jgi:hypothetical protein
MNDDKADEVCSVSFYDVFIELNNYYQQTGSFAIPIDHPTLAFVIDGLTAIGTEQLIEQRWNDKLEDLVSFQAQHGHCNTSIHTDDHDLDNWAHMQRIYCKLYEEQQPSPLTAARYERLRNIGLTKAPNKWEQRYQELRQYQLENGHADVPIYFPKLGVWALNQRFNLDNMPQDRIDKLDAIGFTWNYNTRSSNEEAWNAKYELLLDYIHEHGHPNVPKSNEPLSCWVRKQRYEYSKFVKKKKSQITRDRISKLNEIGFSFRLRADTIPWEQRFEDLVRFKQEHGHFNITRNHSSLGSWSMYQRNQFKCFLEGRPSTIDQAKADKLISIGFLDIESMSSSRPAVQIPVLPNTLQGIHRGIENVHEYHWDNEFGFGFNQG